MKERSPCDVVVCVHNSPEDVSNCLNSVLPTLGSADRLIVVDDGSDDTTRLICEDIDKRGGEAVLLIRRQKGSGFCKAANAGLAETSAEMVIVLNSDTIVAADWIDRMSRCMTSYRDVGIVGPLSNAGGWQTIPTYGNDGPPNVRLKNDGEHTAQIQDYCSKFCEAFDYPFVEQINGFCFGVSREVLDVVGVFDEFHFPMGYGEENDLVFRSLDAGFLCAIAIDCFVYHAKTKSYTSDQRKKYAAAGQAALYELHSEQRVKEAVLSTQNHPILKKIRNESSSAFAEMGWI